MATNESQEQKEVIQEAHREGRTVHFAALVDICASDTWPEGLFTRRLLVTVCASDTWPEGLLTRRSLVTVCASLELVSCASVHWFDSLLEFLTSLHGIGSLIRFTAALNSKSHPHSVRVSLPLPLSHKP